MSLKNQIKYRGLLFELCCIRTWRRIKLCLRFLSSVFWLIIPWIVIIFTVCLFENKSFCDVLYEAKYDVFTSVILAAISILSLKIPQYRLCLKRRYSLELDINMVVYSLREIFEEREIDIAKLSNEINNMKEIYEKIKQLQLEFEGFVCERERKDFKWLADRFFAQLSLFDSKALFEKEEQEVMISVLNDLDEYLNLLWTRDRDIQRRILRIIKDYCFDWKQSAEFYIFANEEEFKNG